MENNNKLHINIRGRGKVLFQGEADSVSAENDAGPFDILPGHANFITLVHGKIQMHTDTGEKVYDVEDGLMKVIKDSVDIFLGIR